MRDVAQEERAALSLGPTDPFDPYALAEAHGIPVYTLNSLREFGVDTEPISHFTARDSSAWSAALVPLGTARVIIENESHAAARRRSNISHELGHHLLEHPFDNVIFGEDHKRQFNEQQERQATFIAGELLIPLAAAERMAFDGWDNARVAATYGVSEQFAQMQMRGQRVRAQRAAHKYGSGLQLCARDPERSLAVLRADEHPRGRPPGSLQHRHIYDENLELNRRVSINLHKCSQGAAVREKVQSKMRPYNACRVSLRLTC